MATVNTPYLHDITGAGDPTKSTITLDYTVTFSWVDMDLNQPYHVLVRVWGDDTNVAGDAPGGADDFRYSWYTRYISPKNGAIQKFTDIFQPGTIWLNEDSSSEPQNSTLDDIRVRVTLDPLKPEEVTSEESNLKQVLLQP